MQKAQLKYIVVFLLLTINYSFSKDQVFHHYAHLGHYPTAIPVKKFHLENRIYITPGGAVTLSVNYGLGSFFSFGGVWGVDSLISSQDVDYSYPQFTFKYTLFFEDTYIPALSIGYDDVGRQNLFVGNTQNDYFKSRGLYLAISKYFFFLRRPLSFSGGINYSWIDNKTENYENQLSNNDSRHGKNDVFSGYLSSDFIVSNIFSFYGIYDLALDDNLNRNPLKGFLNLAIRLHIGDITLNLEWQDILRNKRIYSNNIPKKQRFRREVQIIYLKNI